MTDDRKHDDDLDFDVEFVLDDDFSDDFLDDDVDPQAPARHRPAAKTGASPAARRRRDADADQDQESDAGELRLSDALPVADDDWSADGAGRTAEAAADSDGEDAERTGVLRLSNDFDGVVDDWSADFATEEADDLFAELEVEDVDGEVDGRGAPADDADRTDESTTARTDRDEVAAAAAARTAGAERPQSAVFGAGAQRRDDAFAFADQNEHDDDDDDLFAGLDDPADTADADPAAEPAPWARDDLDDEALGTDDVDSRATAPAFAGLELRDGSPFAPRAEPGAQSAGADDDPDIEAALFGGIARDPSYNAFTGQSDGAFAEDGPGWPGADEDVEAIVTAAADDDLGHAGVFDLDDVEIEQVDPDSVPARPRTPRRPAAPEPVGAAAADVPWLDAAADDDGFDADQGYVVVDDQDAFVGAGAGAELELLDEAPPEEFDEEDPIYGADVEAAPAAGVPGFEIPVGQAARRQSDEFEDDPYIDDTADDYEVHVVGPGEGRSRTALWGSLAAVAALLVIAGLSVTMIAPEWLGLAPGAPKVDRAAIARPQIGLVRRAPDLPTVAVADPTPVPPAIGTEPEQPPRSDPGPVAVATPGEPAVTVEVTPPAEPTEPSTEPSAPSDPTLAGEPRPTDPIQGGEPAPVVALPEIDREAVAAARRPERTRRVRTGFEPIDQGGDLVIAGPTRDVVDHGGDVVAPGDRAFAQLANDAVFIGTVRKIDLAAVTLDMPAGEVTLPRTELVALLHYDDSIGSEFVKDARGYVEIENANRLQGRIVHTASTDSMVLETDDSRITVPRSAVVQVGTYAGDGVDLGPLEDEATSRWLRDRALRRMQQPAEPRAAGAKPSPRR